MGNFKLFISLDMSVITTAAGVQAWTLPYVNQTAQFTYQGRPFFSTFSGETITFNSTSLSAGWQTVLKGPLQQENLNPYFVPGQSSPRCGLAEPH